MTLSLLEFAQKCLRDVDHAFLTLFDLKKGEEASFSTYPEEWCTRYLSQKYYEHDYVFLKHLYLPVVWGEQISKSVPPMQKQIFKEAQDFHIYKGITIPFLTPNLREFLTIAFNKKDKLSENRLLSLSLKLQMTSQMIFTYKHIIENDSGTQSEAIQFIEEIASWQKASVRQRNKRDNAIAEILSDIRASQMFITHHETKELGLETLQRAYKDIERLS